MLDWQQLVRLPDGLLGLQDIAAVNLTCAVGFPDAAAIDAPLCLRRLDYWATCVRAFTDSVMSQFYRAPEEYQNSEGCFRSLCMITALQSHLGVRYNPAKIPFDSSRDTADLFVHGAILGEGGTCASLPVLYIAVGRRLGYPLKLVQTKWKSPYCGHYFVRWEDPQGERFNIEGSCRGFKSPPDDYYRTGNYDVTPEQVRKGCLLQSMSPRQELASFLAERAIHWLALGCPRQATEAFAWAFSLHSENRMIWNTMCRTIDEWNTELQTRRPANFPAIRFSSLTPRRYPESLPRVVEDDILFLEATENMLKDPELDARWWEPARRGGRGCDTPSVAHIVWRSDGGCGIRFARDRSTVMGQLGKNSKTSSQDDQP
jgi:predicted Fe-S protein YdhL (DUF1289 family)